MKIGVDASSITPNMAGVGYYTVGMVKALQQVDKTNEYFLFTNDSKNLEFLKLKSNFHIIEIEAEKVNFLWIIKVVRFSKKNKFDSFFSASNFSFGILYNKTIQVVHDLAPIKYPQFFSKKGSLSYKIQFDQCLKRCKAIFPTSETIKNEVIEYMPKIKDKVKSGGFGANSWAWKPTNLEEMVKVKNEYALPPKYFLSVGTLEPRKNYINTILAFNEFYKENNDFHYVIVGKKGWFYDEIFAVVEKCEAKENIHFLGYVPEEKLAPIFDNAKGVIMLSFYEGIGLSALEAYIRGIPTLVSNIPVFHEVVGKNGVFANPNDVKSIKIGMNRLKVQERKGFRNINKYKWSNPAKVLLTNFLP